MENEINPHMPQYIVQAPWYLNQHEISLNHQYQSKKSSSKLSINTFTKKGFLKEKIVKFRKGACENCGAITHKTKDCLERIRRRGAKYTNKDFGRDEYIDEIKYDSYDSKRDRWNGYIEEDKNWELFDQVDKERKKNGIVLDEENILKNKIRDKDEEEFEKKFEQNLEKTLKENDNNDKKEENKETISYDLYKKENNLTKNKEEDNKNIIKGITSKSLFLGLDYSKYLLNLNLNSAYYDAKSRSMRENPLPDNIYNAFKGENYVKNSGDALKLNRMEKFIEKANNINKNLKLNNIAMPTQAELFSKYIENKEENTKKNLKSKLIEKYGGEEYLNIEVKKIDDEIEEKNIENGGVNYNGHTQQWGSFYHQDFGWGYKCCYSFDKHCICGGEEMRKKNFEKLLEYDRKKISMIENDYLKKKINRS